ncbi:MAG TPA: hypothetical protein VNG53_04115 [Bacteroidia bacterium]|nr:hypothetical protein [Bacteroidia bacterium]
MENWKLPYSQFPNQVWNDGFLQIFAIVGVISPAIHEQFLLVGKNTNKGIKFFE